MKYQALDRLKNELLKDHIEFKEVQETIIIPSKTIRIPSIICKPLQIDVLSSHNFRCRFDKHYSNENKTETITKDFSYFVPMYRYIKKYLKGEL